MRPLALLAFLAACSTGSIERFDQVEIGMTHDEVIEIIGTPSSSYTRKVDESGRVIRLERWQYGDVLSTLATSAVYSEHPPDRVWSVSFDEQGQVVQRHEPDWSAQPLPGTVQSSVPSRSR